MIRKSKLQKIIEAYPDEEFLKMDGYDDCIVGVAEQFNNMVLVYDRTKVLCKNMKLMKCDYSSALEYYEFNQLGSYMGEKTPIFLTPITGRKYG